MYTLRLSTSNVFVTMKLRYHRKLLRLSKIGIVRSNALNFKIVSKSKMTLAIAANVLHLCSLILLSTLYLLSHMRTPVFFFCKPICHSSRAVISYCPFSGCVMGCRIPQQHVAVFTVHPYSITNKWPVTVLTSMYISVIISLRILFRFRFTPRYS